MESLVSQLDVGVFGAAWRAGLGFLLLPLLSRLAPGVGPGQGTVAFLAMLFGIKVAAAVARRLVPVGQQARDLWAARRNLATNFDSYQWRKLVWFGLGVLAAQATGVSPAPWAWGLGAACVLSGLGGEIAWRRHETARTAAGQV